ncbi:LLM class flavin-dependent oxidoreductase [Mycobacterium spongiae]|uniref:LLM class flavin-dependent oxidoreductase n=1 Tax=Mycobacterium spongiae TaxID=886343 RepID=A0A975K066_9MYCO|nr:LLM class flavin-dependent oxidoreductase [Mycobacterium spongiae]QUR67778.1 LLM class flavin-dependent oxidoreductase [Mycobacterium spongiae]
MRFSVWLDTGQPWSGLLNQAQQADAGFWHCVYVADHFVASADYLGGETGMLEATATVAALAGATSRVRLGTLVLAMTYRHPAVLANWAATVDHASNGRLTLGLGTGAQVNEHEHYGLEFGTPRQRVDRFSEGLDVITALLARSRTTMHGRHYRLDDAPCDPKPVQSPLPLLIGGSGPRMLRLVARHASQWNNWSSPGSFRAMTEKLDAACDQVGRDPETVARSTQALTIVTTTPEQEARAVARADREPWRPVLHGSPDRIADAVAVWRDEGVDEVIFPDRAIPSDQRRDAFDALAEALAPLV